MRVLFIICSDLPGSVRLESMLVALDEFLSSWSTL